MYGKFLLIILYLLIAVCLAGCLAPLSPSQGLTGSSWRLTSYNADNKLVATGPDSMILLEFSPDGLMSGTTGCNNYSGRYHTEGEIISFSEIGSTEKYCTVPDGVMNREQQYLLHLHNTTRYSVAKDELTLSYYDEKKLLVFKKQRT
jgi:heat shock protein HslJ